MENAPPLMIPRAVRATLLVPEETAADTERRRHPRRRSQECAWLRDMRLKYGPPVPVIDVSRGGVLIETERALARGATIVLELAMATERVVLPARVRRSERRVHQDRLYYRVACAFLRPAALPPAAPAPEAAARTTPVAARAAAVPRDPQVSGSAGAFQKVVARYRDGNLLRGYTCDFHPARPQLHLWEDPSAPDALLIPVTQLKALFFVREFTGDASRTDRREFTAVAQGRRVEITFHDGEVLIGSTLNYRADGPGFFVLPADAASNNQRVFVISSAIRHLRFL